MLQDMGIVQSVQLHIGGSRETVHCICSHNLVGIGGSGLGGELTEATGHAPKESEASP